MISRITRFLEHIGHVSLGLKSPQEGNGNDSPLCRMRSQPNESLADDANALPLGSTVITRYKW
jgi:hypothetical protein